jgi:hypothetical protein
VYNSAMERRAFEQYSAVFIKALAAFDGVVGVAALGSTADGEIQDSWSDHDFAVVLRDGDADQFFLNDVSWMPEAKRNIASARHGGIYNVAIYDDGHKVEYLVCNERATKSITVTKFCILLDRSDVGRRMEEARVLTSARQKATAEQACDPVNLAIVMLTAAQRLQRGELVSAISLLAAATDMALCMLAETSPSWVLTDPLDPRRRLEQCQPNLAKKILEIAASSPENAVANLVMFVDASVRSKTPSWNWSAFDRVIRRLPSRPNL